MTRASGAAASASPARYAPISSTGMRPGAEESVLAAARLMSCPHVYGATRIPRGCDRATGKGVTMDASERELQQYLFDLHGYLVIHNVLGAAELAELNRLIDAQGLPSPRESIRFGSAAGKHGPDHGFLNWGETLCRLLDHQAIMPILRFRLGHGCGP